MDQTVIAGVLGVLSAFSRAREVLGVVAARWEHG